MPPDRLGVESVQGERAVAAEFVIQVDGAPGVHRQHERVGHVQHPFQRFRPRARARVQQAQIRF